MYRYKGNPESSEGKTEFKDADKISDWAAKALVWATAEGLINGKPGGIFDPQGNATRAEVATILQRLARGYGLGTVTACSWQE